MGCRQQLCSLLCLHLLGFSSLGPCLQASLPEPIPVSTDPSTISCPPQGLSGATSIAGAGSL